jgi:soluble lytic murein transglycosylase
LIPDWQRDISVAAVRRWTIAYPRPHLEIVRIEAERTGLEEALIYAVMREESAFMTGVHSYAGAQGLMQLMPRTARGHAEEVAGEITIERLAEPEVNVRIGANFLAHLGRHLDESRLLMVAAYNAGRGAVGRWLSERRLEDPGFWVEHIGPSQTRNYSKRVLGSLEIYDFLYTISR